MKYKVFLPLNVFEEASREEGSFLEQILNDLEADGMTFQAVLSDNGDHSVLGALFEFTSKEKAIPMMLSGGHNDLPPDSKVHPERHTLFDEQYEATEEDG